MAKKFKVMSHAERTQCPQKIGKCVVYGVEEVMSSEEEVVHGRIVKTLKKKVVDPKERVAGLKVSDFYMENLQASGAINNMKNCTLNGSTIASIDSAVAGLEALENINISEE